MKLASSYVVGVFVLLLFACSSDIHDHDDFREDVFDCEQALARLTTCCPSFDASAVHCSYSYDFTDEGGCEPTKTTDSVMPALDTAESRCILGMSCSTIVTNGVCGRAQKATPYTEHDETNDSFYIPNEPTSTSHAPVCP